MSQQPSVGRIVHYYRRGDGSGMTGPFAALITAVNDDGTAELEVHSPGYTFPRYHVEQSETPVSERWMWPPRV